MNVARKSVLAIFAACVSFVLHAALVPLQNGSVISTGDTALYKATENVTVKLSGDAVDGIFPLSAGFYINDGVTVTVDVSGVENLSEIRMTGSLRGTGVFKLGAGAGKLVFGAASVNHDNIIHLPALESAVSFTDASGEVVMTNGVSLVS